MFWLKPTPIELITTALQQKHTFFIHFSSCHIFERQLITSKLHLQNFIIR